MAQTKEQKRASAKTYYARHAEKLRQKSRDLNRTPERREYQRNYMRVRRQDPVMRSAELERDRWWKKAQYRTPSGRLKLVAQSLKFRAKRKNLDYYKSYIKTLVDNPPERCACCGLKFDYADSDMSTRETSPSFDRVDNSKGYVHDNLRIICFRCNSIKKDATVEELQCVIKYMEENLK